MSLSPGSSPKVVATVTREEDIQFIGHSFSDDIADILEFRLDNLHEHLDAAESCMASLPSPAGILTTVRHFEEGGAVNLAAEERVSIYGRFLERSDFIDIELRSMELPGFAGLVEEAKSTGVSVIVSFHDFENCPSRDDLFERVERAYDLGADIAKVAVVVEKFHEIQLLVELVEALRDEGEEISAMGMGSLGKISRLTLGKAGSCLNYGFLEKPNAPGQLSASRLKEMLALL